MKQADLPIGSPCSVDWASMTPTDKGRFCADCKKVVHELSRMTEREARALVGSAGKGQLCVRYVYDQNGKVFFAGDVPQRAFVPSSLLNRAKRAALLALAAAVPLATAACNSREVMGDLVGDYADPVVAEDAGGDAADASADANAGDARTDGGRADAATDGGDADPDASLPIE